LNQRCAPISLEHGSSVVGRGFSHDLGISRAVRL
jgi:hypothetical protein